MSKTSFFSGTAVTNNQTNAIEASKSQAASSAAQAAASAVTSTAQATASTASKVASVSAKDASVVAKDASLAAKNLAVTAKDASVVAKDASLAAKDLAVAAQGQAEGFKNTASTKANEASASATTASNQATASASSATTSTASKNTAVAVTANFLGAHSSAPTQTAAGGSLAVGMLYFDTGSDVLKVRASGGWINAGSSINGTSARFAYTLTANQTTVTGNDANGNPLAYDSGFADVYLNGVKLAAGDFTATSGTSIVLAAGATANDILEVVAFGTFQLSNGSFTGTTTVQNLAVTGTVDGQDVAAMGSKLAGIEASATADQTKSDIEGLGIDVPAANITGTIAAARLSTAATQAESDDSTKIATTAYVVDKITTLIGGAPSTLDDLNELAQAINDDASYNSTLITALATKMPKAGGAFTGGVDITGTLATSSTITVTTSASTKAGSFVGNGIEIKHPTGASNLFIGTQTGNDVKIAAIGAKSMRLDTNGEERLHISSAGLVGIGTGAPDSPLTVQPSAQGTGTNNVQSWMYSLSNGSEFDLKLKQVVASGLVKYAFDLRNDGDSYANNLVLDRGNVGIGCVPSSIKSGFDTLQIGGNLTLNVDSTGAGAGVYMGNNVYRDSTNSRWEYINTDEASQYLQANGTHVWRYAPSGSANAAISWSEAMRISSGNLLLGTTSTLISAGGPLQVKSRTGSEHVATFQNGVSNGGFGIRFLNVAGSSVGSIAWTGSVTNYNTSSDYRLKENVDYTWDATTRLKQLKPARFNFIADADTTVDGFLAHEAQAIVPECVVGTKDAMRDEEYEVTSAVIDENGTETTPAVMGTRSVPDHQGIDQSKLVPLLVKTIQELEARITALEA